MLLCLHECRMRGWRGPFGLGYDGAPFSIGPISGGEDRGLVRPEGDSWSRPDLIRRGREEKVFALGFSSLGAFL